MNEHILFVIDHLANPGKYTQEELEANFDAARSVAARSAAAYWAAYWTAYDDNAVAAYWIDEYFKDTGEDKQTYLDKLGE
jgi:hypothetical protein